MTRPLGCEDEELDDMANVRRIDCNRGICRRRGKQDLKRKSVGDYFRLGANIESHRIIPSVERADAPVEGTSSSRLAATELDTTRIGGDSVRMCGENFLLIDASCHSRTTEVRHWGNFERMTEVWQSKLREKQLYYVRVIGLSTVICEEGYVDG